MSRPNFFEPKPILQNIPIKFEDIESNSERIKPVIKRRTRFQEHNVSILGKRKLEAAFGRGMNDKERYGQEIPPEFFKLNRGHNAFPSSISNTPITFKNLYEDRLKYWREKYNSKH